MKGRICYSCDTLRPLQESSCKKCGELLPDIKIEDAREYDESDFYRIVKNSSDTDIKSDVVTKKSYTSVNTSNMPDDYKATIFISKFISFLGWLVCIIALILAVITVSNTRSIGLLAIFPALGTLIGGLILVLAGQVTRATVENTNYSRQMLEMLKKT